MKITFILVIVFFTFQLAVSQPNCNVYIWQGDTAQYMACKLLEENINNHYQFSKEFQALVDSAISICPRFAFAYREKAAPYVKSGNFIEWKKYIDLAVKYDTLSYLPVRASLRYKFFADYVGSIEDIELLEKKATGDIGYSSNGTYHLSVVKALCLKQTGRITEGIQILEEFVSKENYMPGLYDYLHLGVMCLETGDFNKSKKYLLLQNVQYEYAETYYYLSLLSKKANQFEEVNYFKKKSEDLYQKSQKLNDPYNYLIDQIDYQQIGQG